MMALRLNAHHMSFPVKDLARSRAFYEGVLGLVEIPRPGLGLPGAWYRAGACEVHLIETPPGVDVGQPAPTLTPLARHAAFAIDDYEATLQHLRTQLTEVLATSPKLGQIWVRDPDGHILEFIVPRTP
jgi:catechol 2,3-dioxygenase-like lactoylglutathione lyase family enzyme